MKRVGKQRFREIWRDMQRNIVEHDKLALELMRHPDVTPAQLWELHIKSLALHRSIREVKRDGIKAGYLEGGV